MVDLCIPLHSTFLPSIYYLVQVLLVYESESTSLFHLWKTKETSDTRDLFDVEKLTNVIYKKILIHIIVEYIVAQCRFT